MEDFAQALRSVGEPIFGKDATDVSMARVLLQLFDITRQFGMHLRPELILLQKTMVQVEGVARSIDPAHNIWQAAKPIVDRWSRREFGPEGLQKLAVSTAREAMARLRRLPETLQKLDEALNRAAEPAPAPVIVKRTTGWGWLLTGVVITAASAAGLWFVLLYKPLVRAQRTRLSTTSHMRATASTPLRRFSARAPVGEVTLISVIMPPMTSMPTKIRPALLQLRPDAGADFLFARAQVRRLGRAADDEVGADGADGRLAVDGADGLAVDDQDALVALADGREEGLRDEGLGDHLVEEVDDGFKIAVLAADLEHACPAMAVQRLQHDVAVALAEFAHAGDVARDERGRLQVGKQERQDFFRATSARRPDR